MEALMAATQTQGSGAAQGTLWGSAAEDWARLMEPQGRALFDAVLASGPFTPGVRVLDAGCGSGLFPQLLARRGCRVTGLDASERLLSIARRNNPDAAFRQGDLEALPFPDQHFDVVTGINAFQYAADPRHAFSEARRVIRRGGHVIAAVWGPANACEAAGYLAALKSMLPPRPGAPGPFALSDEAALMSFVSSAGLTPQTVTDVDVTWLFDDVESAMTGMLSAGPSVLAIRTSGRDAVAAAIMRSIDPYRLANGGYRLENRFRYITATRD
jgi:SAM-dependent methyltransferase